jgi:hypothetical protein
MSLTQSRASRLGWVVREPGEAHAICCSMTAATRPASARPMRIECECITRDALAKQGEK